MKIISVLSLVAIATLAGCSSAPRPGNYECELREDPVGKCASMQTAYKSSQNMTANEAANVQSVFEARNGRPAAGAQGAPIVGAQASGYPDVGEAGMPVFKQPKVMRVWVAPYVDAEGNLRSGEYTYFSTPGQWNYGDLKKPGAAAGMFGPARADNLGFTQAPQPKAAPPKPAESPRTDLPTSVGATPAQGSSPAGAATSGAGAAQITQPYQRLTNN